LENSISIVITSAHEPKTIGRALKAIINQDCPEILEILIVSPDKKTQNQAKKASGQSKKIKILKDPGRGKPAALNFALKQTQGQVIILTDGDVFLAPNALKPLLAPFKNPRVGGTCGRPVPTNNKKTLFGFWAHFLTDSADQIRKETSSKNGFIELSGYLLAIKKEVYSEIPEKTLADDSHLSHLVAQAGFVSKYVPRAKVFVKYPTNLADWFKQKKRSAFEYLNKKYSSGNKMRTPLKEIILGFRYALAYPKNLSQFLWLILLFGARLFLWGQILFLNLVPGSKEKLWQPVPSTKS